MQTHKHFASRPQSLMIKGRALPSDCLSFGVSAGALLLRPSLGAAREATLCGGTQAFHCGAQA